MKKILLTLVAVMAMTSCLMAQEDNSNGRPRGGMRMDPTEMIKHRTEQMTQELNLTAEQVTAVQALNEKYMKRQGPRGQRSEGNDSVKAKRPRPENVDGTTGASDQASKKSDNSKKEKKEKKSKKSAEANDGTEQAKSGQSDEAGPRQQGGHRGNGGPRRGMPNMDEYNNELKAILTAEQYSTYEENMKKMMQRGPKRD